MEHNLLQHFRCLPSELDDEDYYRIENYLTCEWAIGQWGKK